MYFKPLFKTCLLLSHWPKQVTWLFLMSRVEKDDLPSEYFTRTKLFSPGCRHPQPMGLPRIHIWLTGHSQEGLLKTVSVKHQFSSVAQSCPTLYDPMDRSTPGLPVYQQLLEFTQTHVHWVSDAIQPSNPLSSPSPPAPNPFQHQGLFQWPLHMRWPKYWSFSFSIIPSKEIPGLISFRVNGSTIIL